MNSLRCFFFQHRRILWLLLLDSIIIQYISLQGISFHSLKNIDLSLQHYYWIEVEQVINNNERRKNSTDDGNPKINKRINNNTNKVIINDTNNDNEKEASIMNNNKAGEVKNGMAACLLIMDDSIRLLEWLAYHYTVLPLEELLVVLDPASQRKNSVLEVLDLYRDRINIKVHTNETEWLKILPEEGWDGIKPGIYKDASNKTKEGGYNDWFMNKNSTYYKQREYIRRQKNFISYCMNYMKVERKRKWTLFTDTDEFIVYNYMHKEEEDPKTYDEMRYFSKELKDKYDKERRRVKRYRKNAPSIRTQQRITISQYLQQTNFTAGKGCIVLPGLSFSSKEEGEERNLTTRTIESKLLQTYRYSFLNQNRTGSFTKALIDVSRLPDNRTLKDIVSAHLPSKQLCTKIDEAGKFRTDYISSVLRLHHYRSGSWEGFAERSSDPRIDNDKSLLDRYLRRSRSNSDTERQIQQQKEEALSLIKDEDIKGWLDWFIEIVGGEGEADRLLFQPLKKRYDEFKISNDEDITKLKNELSLK